MERGRGNKASSVGPDKGAAAAWPVVCPVAVKVTDQGLAANKLAVAAGRGARVHLHPRHL